MQAPEAQQQPLPTYVPAPGYAPAPGNAPSSGYISSPGTWKTKLGLRIASVVFLIIIAGLGGSLATTDRMHISYSMVLLAPALIITCLWDVAEIVSICKRGGNRGIHPGAIVAVDLIAWLGWIFVSFIFIAIAISPRSYINDWSGYTRDAYGYRNYNSKVTPEDLKLENVIKQKGRAALAFIAFTVLTHFALFVIACYETNRRRHTQTVYQYIMQPVYGPPGTVPGTYQHQHFQAMPMQPQQVTLPQYLQAAQQANGQVPTQPPPAHNAETKGGPERFA